MEADYSKILDAYLERNISNSDYLMANDELRGYGGMCLPKDVRALIYLTKKLKIPLKLFKAIDHDNQNLETTVYKGMRNAIDHRIHYRRSKLYQVYKKMRKD